MYVWGCGQIQCRRRALVVRRKMARHCCQGLLHDPTQPIPARNQKEPIRNHSMALRSTGRLLAAASSALSWTASQRVRQTAVRGCSRLSIGNKHRQLSIGVCLQTYQQLCIKTTNTSPRDQCHGALAVAHYPALHVVLNGSYTQPHTVVKTMTH